MGDAQFVSASVQKAQSGPKTGHLFFGIGNWAVLSRTTSLDKLLTKKKAKDDEHTVSAGRFDQLECWAQQVGNKLGIKLEV
jgi:hypothetical protein